MTIRPATVADAQTLSRVAIQTMHEAFGPPANPAEWVEAYCREALTVPILTAELTDPRSTYFVAETTDHQLIGYVKLRHKSPPRRLAERNALEIQRIYLLDSVTGQGWGRRLMEHCFAVARQRGHRAVYLGVWERNHRGIAFYEKMGFVRFGWHRFQFGPDRQRDIWFVRSLY
jgi:diamine N-acetyltransferase